MSLKNSSNNIVHCRNHNLYQKPNSLYFDAVYLFLVNIMHTYQSSHVVFNYK